ncbi:MAG: protein-glutamate O-methyltransferase CheR [Pseudodesulfovibrio sp.]|uniref:protein-glutamate O-methyltransferase n=1 Tax=Pseudodesulfovibrio aespoeensis (strain ATCC 700646 / DSM 10631 / Aspo-2) TaxID=643562 RepID=E6VTY2_PSEA9|nr:MULTISPECIES: protein-glutamate O-methyltransferase CheR [Pseudodesulfovibrio]MBU4191274.1 protein-glutamate O-methyltransferase CheR [Pseudomonadota bacterium]ADU61074.1 Protein-glutamate O-methyltransferase [Pseudodesulfovibrio aespoeensis Aspo-2]MBU4244093.1 protein-glutamate O-methyltransferase CheR [Pseudomonadota bacterium]MBU4379320.1 protein-glutamate O-methyltransferase CheR [Pseudomonadota bacterium]MBU4476454.1 protein-glutamate O-methyltransferase CheR [Pseudomonadota bacterium]
MGSLFSNAISLRKSVGISDAEFMQLRDFIYEKCGIFVDIKRKYLFESRFSKRLNDLGLPGFADYIKYLKFDMRKNEELATLFELVTTNETSFCRDGKQLEAFQDKVLKEVLDAQRKAGRLELNIWSAGCSSGEEPYTLSILLHETLRAEIARWRIAITAVDLSRAMVERAREGVYADYAFKTTPDDIRQKYFVNSPSGWKIKPEVARIVTFQEMNLNDPLALKRVPRSHIVFCRNVVIYFDDAMKRKVVSSFYDNLLPGGYLMLGHSETLHKVSSSFKPVYHPGTIAYLKEG